MKLTRTSILSAASLLVGGFIGASTLVALASGAPWTGPTNTPPLDNVAAPINVGVQGVSALQEKFDSLMIDGGLGVWGNLFIASGASTTPGSVLTNVNGDGYGSWQPASAVGSTPVNREIFNSSGTWTVPAGVSQITVFVWGAGGGAGGSESGGSGNYCAMSGQGGGGGAYAQATISVTSGDTYNITVGKGGLGGAAHTANSCGGEFGSPGTTGGSSSFGSLIIAGGGSGGNGGNYGPNNGTLRVTSYMSNATGGVSVINSSALGFGLFGQAVSTDPGITSAGSKGGYSGAGDSSTHIGKGGDGIYPANYSLQNGLPGTDGLVVISY